MISQLIIEEAEKTLDEIEAAYDRNEAKCKYYGGEIVPCTVFVINEERLENETGAPMVKNSIPKERYLDIMIEGAKHFGVSPDHVQWLENHDKQPRK